jgi:hypothetical protein
MDHIFNTGLELTSNCGLICSKEPSGFEAFKACTYKEAQQQKIENLDASAVYFYYKQAC